MPDSRRLPATQMLLPLRGSVRARANKCNLLCGRSRPRPAAVLTRSGATRDRERAAASHPPASGLARVRCCRGARTSYPAAGACGRGHDARPLLAHAEDLLLTARIILLDPGASGCLGRVRPYRIWIAGALSRCDREHGWTCRTVSTASRSPKAPRSEAGIGRRGSGRVPSGPETNHRSTKRQPT
jgi:hypothetical protein